MSIKKHQIKCKNCGKILDMRDLGEILGHEDNCGDKINVDYSGSQKIGDSVFYTKEKIRIDLN